MEYTVKIKMTDGGRWTFDKLTAVPILYDAGSSLVIIDGDSTYQFNPACIMSIAAEPYTDEPEPPPPPIAKPNIVTPRKPWWYTIFSNNPEHL